MDLKKMTYNELCYELKLHIKKTKEFQKEINKTIEKIKELEVELKKRCNNLGTMYRN